MFNAISFAMALRDSYVYKITIYINLKNVCRNATDNIQTMGDYV